jgi:hypothetical protein
MLNGRRVKPSNATSIKTVAVWKDDKHASCGLLPAVDAVS